MIRKKLECKFFSIRLYYSRLQNWHCTFNAKQGKMNIGKAIVRN